MSTDKVDLLKAEGNAATAAGNHEEAIKLYSEAILLSPTNHVLYSNRSAAYAQLNQYSKALEDAESTIRCKPDWPKGYSRKGLALSYLKRYDESVEAYEAGLKLDPNNAMLKGGLSDVQAARDSSSGFPNPFADPSMMTKLAMNPKTRHLVNDKEFLGILKMIQANPSLLSSFLKDQRVMLALSAMIGIDLSSDVDMENEPSAPNDSRFNGTASSASHSSESSNVHNNTSHTSKHSDNHKSAETPKQEENLNSSEKQAKAEKELGNVAYKKRDFEQATKHYNKAMELDPKEITYMLNLAAVKFETGAYDECIEVCLNAVEVGRSNRADYKSISKAFSRAASAYQKKNDLKNCKLYYEKALSEHRNPELKTKLSQVEKLIKESEEAAYRNPELAEEERQKGNELFKAGKYSEAVKCYSEAIKRNPDDAKIYSNRAACYTKLTAFDLGLKDCETCIKRDPTFIKGHLRKANLLKAMKENDKALSAYQKALELDESNSEALAGYRECLLSSNDDPESIKKRAMSDPEVQEILRDPGMRMILEQMQENPSAAKEHMKNPQIAQKIQKLLQCGLIAFR